MADPPKYRVILSGNLLPEKSRAEVIDKLALLFHSRLETASKLLQGRAVPMTKEYPRDQAEKICRAIRAAGAECRMEEIGAAVSPTPPDADAVEDDSATRRRTEAGEDEPATDADEDESVADVDEEESAADADEEESAADVDEDETAADADEEETVAATDEDEPAAEEKHAGATGRESALLGFVAVNTDYYGRQFAKFGGAERSSFALSWHWPAFFVFFFWAVYRKLWLWAGVNLAGGVVLALTVKPGFVYLAWALFWPLAANYLYFRHARNRVFQHAPDDGEPAPGGGVSRGAVWLGMVVMFLFSAGLNDLITERMLEQYSERVGDALPEPGSRQRGDGSAIDDLTTLAPKVAKTVAMLGVLTTGFKLAASAKGLEDSQQALSAFEQVIAQKRIQDAWGKQIALRQDATGQVVLLSAGPDGRFDNGDDVLQYIRFDDADGL